MPIVQIIKNIDIVLTVDDDAHDYQEELVDILVGRLLPCFKKFQLFL